MDTIDNSKQGHEDALMAMVEAGMLEGVRALNAEDLDGAKGSIVFYRLPRDIVTEGKVGGQAVADALLVLGNMGAEGRVVLSFDGWADDPRDLFLIPVVVDFCAGLLLGPDIRKRHTLHAPKLLEVLLDEALMASELGGLANAAQVAGRNWLVACAYPLACYLRDSTSGSGWSRDIRINFGITNALLDGVVPPGYGLPGR